MFNAILFNKNQPFFKFILAFLILIRTFSAVGQDSLKLNIQYTTLKMLEQNGIKKVDSSIYLFHQFNPVFKSTDDSFSFDYFYLNTGNTGSPAFKMLFTSESSTLFDDGLHHFDIYHLKNTDVRYYDSWTPYTYLYYVQGPKGMQMLKALHARNITPYWNVAIQYWGIGSTGFYFNQKTKNQTASLTSRFTTKNGKYKGYLSGIRNYSQASENGGLVTDSVFENYSKTDKPFSQVRLNNASQKLMETDLSFYHFFNLVTRDTDRNSKKFLGNELSIQHQISYNESSYGYSSDLSIDTAYYPAIYIDSIQSNDILKVSRLTNTVSLNFNSLQSRRKDSARFKFILIPGIISESDKVTQDTVTHSYNNLILFCRSNIIFEKIGLNADLRYNLSGTNRNDILFRESISFLSKKIKASFGLFQISKSPVYIEDQMLSNHLKWNNDFKATSDVGTCLQVFYRLFAFNINYHTISNYIYYSESINPVQSSKNINYLTCELQLFFRLGHFHFINKALYQSSSNSDVMRYPGWMVSNSWYYENIFFKKVLKVQAGFDFRYIGDYLAYSYFAPYSILYTGASNKLPDILVLEPFINANIKRMNIFVKYEYANRGYPRTYDYLLPHYPADPSSLRFGFS